VKETAPLESPVASFVSSDPLSSPTHTALPPSEKEVSGGEPCECPEDWIEEGPDPLESASDRE